MTNYRDTFNPLFATDLYKLDHRRQYMLSGNTTKVYANFTNRGSRLEGVKHVIHFGLQSFIQDFLIDSFENFFSSPVEDVCEAYERRLLSVLGPNDIGSDHIRALHNLGYIPLVFKSLPEGTLVPTRVPTFTVENTHPDFYWLTNYIESAMSAAIWQTSTSATKAWNLRRLLDKKAAETGTDPATVDFQAHDFSFRGMPGLDAAAASGAGHLLSFKGSDSLISNDWINYFYPGSPSDELILASIPATEHSVMCTGIAKLGEPEMFNRLLDLYPTGLVSIVSDSFDFWKVLTEILPNLKDKVVGRDGKVVIRPDSGDPADIVCGLNTNVDVLWDLGAPASTLPQTPENKGAIELLWDTFGGTVNDKGFKELDPHIGLIYGDSITYERAQEITDRLASKGFASGNIVFGMGSFFYTGGMNGGTTRDTFMSAIKATWAEVDDEGVNILKDPATDNGTKKSATGRLAVLSKMNGDLYLVEKATAEQEANSLIKTVWEDGKFVRTYSFADVRANLRRNTEILERNGSLS